MYQLVWIRGEANGIHTEPLFEGSQAQCNMMRDTLNRLDYELDCSHPVLGINGYWFIERKEA